MPLPVSHSMPSGRPRARASASSAAPKLIESLITLGTAPLEHVEFAMLGLPPLLQRDAEAAAERLRHVAARLVSRRISTSLRIEMKSLYAQAKDTPCTTAADWSSPHAIPIGNGDILPLLLFHARAAPWSCNGYLGDDDWPTRQPFHYKTATCLAQLNHAWRDAVREWCREECAFSMLGGHDSDLATLESFVLLSGENATELHLHDARHVRGVRGREFAPLLSCCPRLQRLLIRLGNDYDIATFIGIIEACPSLIAFDASQCWYIPGQKADLFQALAQRPQLKMYVMPCDDLYILSRRAHADEPDGPSAPPNPQVIPIRCERWNRDEHSIPLTPLGVPGCRACAAAHGAREWRYGWPSW